MTTRMLLVRHGQTAYNAEVRFMGQQDIPLNEVGEAQIRAVAKRLSGEKPALLYTSGLTRAFDTASAIQAAIPSHPEVRIDGRLTEGAFGEWEGQTYQSLKQTDAERLKRWESADIDYAPPGGETVREIAERVRGAYADIMVENKGKTVIVVAHGGSLQVLIMLTLGLPLQDYRKLWVSNASLSELRIGERSAVLHLLNDTSHLRPSG